MSDKDAIENLMHQHFKANAFRVGETVKNVNTGNFVTVITVFHKDNVMFTRRLMRDNGFNVSVQLG